MDASETRFLLKAGELSVVKIELAGNLGADKIDRTRKSHLIEKGAFSNLYAVTIGLGVNAFKPGVGDGEIAPYLSV